MNNFLLIYYFALGIILKHCSGEEDEKDDLGSGNYDFIIGLYINSDKASKVVLLVAICILIIPKKCLTVVLVVNMIRASTVKMISKGHVHNPKLSHDCSFHVFMPHMLAIGKALTHDIAIKIQLILSGLKVWLDVDELNNTSKLEYQL